jgi:hypothetical protein
VSNEVASVKLCEQLFRLSKWDSSLAGGNHRWCLLPNGNWETLRLSDAEAYQPSFKKEWFDGFPAYDLGFLITKMPKYLHHDGDDLRLTLSPQGFGDMGLRDWCATYKDIHEEIPFLELGETPEDAVCLLAIELLKQGVIKA